MYSRTNNIENNSNVVTLVPKASQQFGRSTNEKNVVVTATNPATIRYEKIPTKNKKKNTILDKLLIPEFGALATFFGFNKIYSSVVKPFYGKLIQNKFLNISDKVDFETSEKAVAKMKELFPNLNETKINLVTHENCEQKINEFMTAISEKLQKPNRPKNDFLNKLIEWQKKFMTGQISKAMRAVASGQNAFFAYPNKNIYISEKLYPAVLHELGHAANNSTAWSKVRYLSILQVPIIVAGTVCLALQRTLNKYNEKKCKKSIDKLENKKIKATTDVERDKIENKIVATKKVNKFFGKFNNFMLKTYEKIKDNIGKLVLLTALPTIIEEGVASMKGLKAAKQTFNPQAYKTLKTAYLVAWGSYVVKALVTAVTATSAVHIWDNLRNNKQSTK